VDDSLNEPGKLATLLQLLFALTILSVAPAILIMLTSFTRIVVVLSLLRHALGTQQMPANQIIIGLSLFLTFFIMTPVWNKVNNQALQPYINEQISAKKAFDKTSQAMKKFMLKQTREKDIALFVKISRGERPYLPFLILDMVVASVLLSMGMMMVPPVMISLPFKLLLFVLADGWYLIVGSLVKSFA
jgi:flagellar biosynthetic protein FliP